VVDDEPLLLDLARAALEGTGAEVRCVDGGARAIQEVYTFRPDVVLLDILMPGLDGLSVLRLLRADAALARVEIHMITGRAAPAARTTALKAGANGYLQKPFDPAELRALAARVGRGEPA
jgi:DNA-binding response OmpR family regulator